MLSKLILLFIFAPLIELYLLIKVGQFIGAWYTVLLVIATAVIGAILAKIEGLRVWHGLQSDLRHLKMPTDRIIDGVLILIGGVLLLTPGIITDILGFLLVIPVTRPVFRGALKKKFSKKTKVMTLHN